MHNTTVQINTPQSLQKSLALFQMQRKKQNGSFPVFCTTCTSTSTCRWRQTTTSCNKTCKYSGTEEL